MHTDIDMHAYIYIKMPLYGDILETVLKENLRTKSTTPWHLVHFGRHKQQKAFKERDVSFPSFHFLKAV